MERDPRDEKYIAKAFEDAGNATANEATPRQQAAVERARRALFGKQMRAAEETKS